MMKEEGWALPEMKGLGEDWSGSWKHFKNQIPKLHYYLHNSMANSNIPSFT